MQFNLGSRMALILMAAVAVAGVASAQSEASGFTPPQTNITRMHLTGDAAAVWAVIDREWGRSGCCGRQDLMQNSRYLDLLSDDALVWFWGAPAPVSKESQRMEDAARADSKAWQDKRIAYELYPQGLVIHGNVAVAHYTCSVSVVDKNNEIKTSSCRSTDVLVRERAGAPWKFLTWVTGPLK